MRNLNLNMNFNFAYFPGLTHTRAWQRLREESCALRMRGMAQGTWANKVSHLRIYVAFTTYFGVQDFPVLLGVLLRFMAYLGNGSYAYKSATNIISSIKWFASILDPASTEVFDKVYVSASQKGLKAHLSRPVRQKLPFSVNHLLKFHNILDLSLAKHLSCWCAMLVAFFGCFRLSNLVPSSHSQFDPLKHLVRDDIKFEENIVLVYFKWSKTNQNCSKVAWIPICSVSDCRFNVKLNLEKFFAMCKAPNNAPLFTFEKNVSHTRCSLVRLLDLCVFEANLPTSDYSWHSFRRGSAVFAFELGLADSAVQLLGDWSSSAFKQYLEFAFLRKVSISETIANSFEVCIKDCES